MTLSLQIITTNVKVVVYTSQICWCHMYSTLLQLGTKVCAFTIRVCGVTQVSISNVYRIVPLQSRDSRELRSQIPQLYNRISQYFSNNFD